MAEEIQRQLAMVLDLNKCLGCQTCTIACKRLWTRDEDSCRGYRWTEMFGGFDRDPATIEWKGA